MNSERNKNLPSILVLSSEGADPSWPSELVQDLCKTWSVRHSVQDLEISLASGLPALLIVYSPELSVAWRDWLVNLHRERSQIPVLIITQSEQDTLHKIGLECWPWDLEPVRLREALAQLCQRLSQAAEEEEERELIKLTETMALEARSLLDGLETLLLRLEAEVLDAHNLDIILRRIHTCKGSAGSIPAAHSLHLLCHDFEALLQTIKKSGVRPDDDMINLLLKAQELGFTLVMQLASKQSPSAQLEAKVSETQRELKEASLKLGSQTSATRAESSSSSNHSSSRIPDEIDEDGVWASLMKLSGELIVLKAQMQDLLRSPEMLTIDSNFGRRIRDNSQTYIKLTERLQSEVIAARKLTLDQALIRIPRLVQRTAHDTGKKVRYKPSGLEIEVDRAIGKALSGALTHVLRNSIDHGIETPEQRRLSGKIEEGCLEISARLRQGVIHLTVRDDGAGINRQRVKAKALEKALITPAEAEGLSPDQVNQLIFLPGFSTADTITDISGRGVGMDAVKAAIENLRGTLTLESEEGKFTALHFAIPIPKTVTIENTLLIQAEGLFLAVPERAIAGIVKRADLQLTPVLGSRICQFREHLVPLAAYREMVGRSQGADRHRNFAFCLMLTGRDRIYGLQADRIIARLEAVVRPFDTLVDTLPGLQGTCVLGNGSIAYVVSPSDLTEEASLHIQQHTHEVKYGTR